MRSALDQMDPDNEPLIQDAGSTDGTQEIIAELARPISGSSRPLWSTAR